MPSSFGAHSFMEWALFAFYILSVGLQFGKAQGNRDALLNSAWNTQEHIRIAYDDRLDEYLADSQPAYYFASAVTMAPLFFPVVWFLS